MLELLSRLRPDELAEVLVVSTVVTVGMLAIVTRIIVVSVRRYHERQLATTVILEMLARGMPADEIVRVLKAMPAEDHQHWISVLKRKLGAPTPPNTSS